MSGRIRERVMSGRLRSEGRTGGRRRGAREIDLQVANHRRAEAIGGGHLRQPARPPRMY
ncbi:MAG TPA: hypothetical protein VHK88_11080 [Aquihabitans sp.]|jgi:hypothetical protein|nr:hypothetical protein [Aquihabitans sp.]